MSTPPTATRIVACSALVLLLTPGCSPGEDGAWTVLDHDLTPAELRTIRVDDDGGVWAAGYHSGSLAGFLLHGADGEFDEVPTPAGLLRDFALVDICHLSDGVVWLAGTAHIFRLEGQQWEVFEVPAEIVDGVTSCSFSSGGGGLVVGQSWDGPRIFTFDDGEFLAEALADSVESPDEISLARVLSRGEFGYAAGVRRSDPQGAVLLLRGTDGWSPVELPVGPTAVGPIRDLAWHAGGPEIWVVGDLVLQGDGGSLEVVDFPYRDDFTPRVVAFPGDQEGWIAGFGELAVVHDRFGQWGEVPAERLAPGLDEGLTRTWLVDDGDFPRKTDGWLVGEFADCDDDGACEGGQAILHYDRTANTVPVSADGGWSQPASEGEAGPGIAPTALAVGTDGVQWLAGDADPDGGDPWGQPQLWRRPPGGTWTLSSLPAGVGLHDLHVADDGGIWAVGSRAGADEGDTTGVLLTWDGGAWVEEEVAEFVASNWALFAVAIDGEGRPFAVGRRNAFPLALVRETEGWRIVGIDDFEGSTALQGVAVDGDGRIWVVGSTIPGSGGTEGYVAAGDADGLTRQDVDGLGRQCGSSPCWSLVGVAASGDRVVAVGEAAMLIIDDGEPGPIDTNMTLLDVALPDGGAPWVLAENGWWEPSADGWTVRRHWDPRSGEGISRRLSCVDDDFSRIAGFRQRTDDGPPQLLHAVLVEP